MVGKVFIYKLIICAQRDFSTVIILSIFCDAVLRIIGECVLTSLAHESVLYVKHFAYVCLNAHAIELHLVEICRSLCHKRLCNQIAARNGEQRESKTCDVLSGLNGDHVANSLAVLEELDAIQRRNVYFKDASVRVCADCKACLCALCIIVFVVLDADNR